MSVEESRSKMAKERRIERSMDRVKASLSMEGIHLTAEEEEFVKSSYLNKISKKEFLNQTLKMVNGDE